MSCAARQEALEAWWAGDLDAAAAGELEEHLLACDDCARRVEALASLGAALAAAARAGAAAGCTTAPVLRRLERDGVRVHRYRIAPGGRVPCSVWPEDELMATVLAAPELPAGRIDLVACIGDEAPIRLQDVPVDRRAGEVVLAMPAARERQRPATALRFQLLAVSPEGERALGEYALAHEPWSGPGSPSGRA